MSNFTLKTTESNQTLTVKLSGAMDEDARFPSIDFSKAHNIIVDFAEVQAINSCGIRDWIRWLSGQTHNATMNFANCPKIIIDQINMVEGFLPQGAKVESFFIPYYCDSCDQIENKLMTTAKLKPLGTEEVFQSIKCPSCGKDTEIDIIENKYLKFLSR